MTEQEHIFHIANQAAWETARRQGCYQLESLAREGFIHASTREQVLRTANRFYHGQTGLVLLVIETGRLQAEVRYEDLNEEGMLFPHIYGAVNLDAVTGWVDFLPSTDGIFSFPQQFQAVI